MTRLSIEAYSSYLSIFQTATMRQFGSRCLSTYLNMGSFSERAMDC
jgi:hypothetical protein